SVSGCLSSFWNRIRESGCSATKCWKRERTIPRHLPGSNNKVRPPLRPDRTENSAIPGKQRALTILKSVCGSDVNVLPLLKPIERFIRMPEPTAFNPATELTTLYQKTGKHSKYQKLPSRLQAKLNVEAQTALEHYEQERLQFISKHLDVEGKRLLDVGGNTGYFSFELLDRGARQVDFYEGKE